jgi:hypothetical protein
MGRQGSKSSRIDIYTVRRLTHGEVILLKDAFEELENTGGNK